MKQKRDDRMFINLSYMFDDNAFNLCEELFITITKDYYKVFDVKIVN